MLKQSTTRILTACLVFLWLIPQAAMADDPFVPARSEEGQLKRIQGVPVLILTGTPEEMGEQHGTLLRPQIHQLYKEYLTPFAGGEVGMLAMGLAAQQMEPFIPERYRREMKGLARGSGLTYQQVLVMQTFLDIKKLVQCSTIAVQPSRSADGTPMLARNLDFPSLGIAHRFSLVILRQPENGTKTATIGWPGLLGTLSGMNEHGLSLAMMEVYDRKTRLKGIPYPLVYRAALEGSKTVDEVEHSLKKAARTTSNNLTVSDALGGAAVFEVDVEGVHRRLPDRGVVFSTNHFVSPGFRQDKPCSRFRKLREYFADGKNRVHRKDLEAVLDQVDQGQLNLQAMIFLPAKRSIGVSLGKVPAAKGPYTYLTQSELFP